MMTKVTGPKVLIASAILIATLDCTALFAQEASTAPAPAASDAATPEFDQIMSSMTEPSASNDAQTQNPTPAPTEPSSGKAEQAPAESSTPPAQAAPATATSASESGDTSALLETIPVPQKSASVPEAVKAPRANAQLEEIVVTATKREESLRDIPQSITALSGGDLERSGAQGIDDIVKRVPGVNIASENGFTRITIRGIASLNNTSSTTGILFGNVSFADQYVPLVALDQQIFDLKTVEVLKGPQGTLFGASALNGAIRYVPEPAAIGVFSAKYFAQYVRITHGSADPIFGAAVNVPVGDTAAIRLVGFDRKSPGYIDNLQLGEKDTNRLAQHGARIMGNWQPSEDWNIAVTGATQRTSIYDIALTDSLNGNLSSNNRPRRSPQTDGYDMGGLTIEHTFDWAQFVSETAYVQKNSNHFYENTRNVVPNTSVPLAGISGGGDSTTYSQELRLVSPTDSDSNWRWIGGLFGSRQRMLSKADLQVGNALIPPALNDALLQPVLNGLGLGGLVNPAGNISLLGLIARIQVTEVAAFGEVTRKLGDDWELTLGGRLYRTRSFGNNTQRGALLTVLNQNPAAVKKGGVQEQSFNPKVSLLWHATDDITSYATISKGYRVGGIQSGVTLPISATQAPAAFKSDIIWNYEGGVRTEWLDKTLSADLTAFYIDWRNPQVFQADSTTNLQYLDNVGGVKSPGFDFALRWITPFRVMLTSSATYAKTVTTKAFKTGSGNTAAPGSPWPYAPKWQTATTLSYPLELNDWTITTSLTHTYMGTATNDLNDQKPIFNYRLLDAQIGLASPTYPWIPELNITVNNLLDKRGVTTRIPQGQSVDGGYTQPRTFIIRLSGSF
jgi:outer membrane receptor protein involved in Fe transport